MGAEFRHGFFGFIQQKVLTEKVRRRIGSDRQLRKYQQGDFLPGGFVYQAEDFPAIAGNICHANPGGRCGNTDKAQVFHLFLQLFPTKIMDF